MPGLLARVWYKSVVCTRSAFHVSSQEMVRAFWISDLKIISITREKTDNKSSQDSNLGLLNSGQMLLPTQPPEFCHWSRGQMAYILRHSWIHRVDLQQALTLYDRSCAGTCKVAAANTQFAGCSKQYLGNYYAGSC